MNDVTMKPMIRNVVLPPGAEVVDTIEYLHKCRQYGCHRFWYSELKISHCPSCQHIHIWFNGTSRLK